MKSKSNRKHRIEAAGENPRKARHGRGAAADKWFVCIHCMQPVGQEAFGTEHRNHCPWCLWSRHIDNRPGDRTADCNGAMEPIAVWVRQGGEWAIVHRCRSCGVLHSSRIAGDDNELMLASVAVRPLSQPSFPLERLAVLDYRATIDAAENPPDAKPHRER